MQQKFLRGTTVAVAGALTLLMAAPSRGEIEATTRTGYDAYGHQAMVESPFGSQRHTEHNYLGKPTAVRWDGNQVVDNAVYGEHGALESFDYAGLAGQTARRASFTYDPLERLDSMQLATIGVSGHDYRASALRYDERGLLLGFDRNDRAVGSTQVQYGYSPQGQLRSFEWGGSRIDYGYDARGNLEARGGGLGVPALPSAHYDLANRRAGWVYDDAGRLLEDDERRYRYDAAGRLCLVLDRETGSFLAHYLYDAAGRRVRTLEPDRVSYSFRDSGGDVIAEEVRDRAHELQQVREHVIFDGRQVLRATFEADAAPEVQLTFADRLGHPALSWGDGGENVFEVSPYGLPLAVGGAKPHVGVHGYSGHENDGTGLVNMHARYFDPASARFTKPDLIRDFDPYLPATYNLYQYVGNNPVGYVDPTGLGKIKWKKVGLGALKVVGSIAAVAGAVGLVVAAAPLAASVGLVAALGGTAGVLGGTALATFGVVEVIDGGAKVFEGFGVDTGRPQGGYMMEATGNFGQGVCGCPELFQGAYLTSYFVGGSVFARFGYLEKVPRLQHALHSTHVYTAVPEVWFYAQEVKRMYGEGLFELIMSTDLVVHEDGTKSRVDVSIVHGDGLIDFLVDQPDPYDK